MIEVGSAVALKIKEFDRVWRASRSDHEFMRDLCRGGLPRAVGIVFAQCERGFRVLWSIPQGGTYSLWHKPVELTEIKVM